MTMNPAEDSIAEQFVSVTCSTSHEAILYLRFAKGNLQQAIENYFSDDGRDGETSSVLPPPPPRFSSPPLSGFLSPPPRFSSPPLTGFLSHPPPFGSPPLSSDLSPPPAPREPREDLDHEPDGDGSSFKRAETPTRALPEVYTPSGAVAEPSKGSTYDADLALATRLQREYDAQAADYRLGWGSEHLSKPQRSVPDHWVRNPNWSGFGANFNTPLAGNFSTSLGGLASPPFPQKVTRSQVPDEILSTLTWEEAQEVGIKEERWILINIHDPAIAKCQLLNRDVWNDVKVVDMVREKFIFFQCRKEEYRAREYISFHFPVYKLQGAYPHIAIVDPRSGEQLMLWSGHVPKAKDFLADIREFLDLYSLNPRSKKAMGKGKGKEIKEPMRERVVEAETEADQPWYIQSVEQPMSIFDDLYGVSDSEESPHGKPNTPTSPSPPSNPFRFGEVSSSPKSETVNPSQSSSSHTRRASTTIINFCRLSGQATTTQTFTSSDPVRTMYEWLESREGGEGKKRDGRRIFLSVEGRDLSEALNERIGDIPGLVGNDDGGERMANVLVDTVLCNEVVVGRERN